MAYYTASRLPLPLPQRQRMAGCPLSALRSRVCGMVKIDVDAVGKMLDELLAPVEPSTYEDYEPEYEFLMPAPPCTCSCH